MRRPLSNNQSQIQSKIVHHHQKEKRVQQVDPLKETVQKLKGQQNTLYMKQLEFQVVSNMDADKLHEILLNKNMVLFDSVSKQNEEYKAQVKIEVDPNKMLDRTARKEKYAQNYIISKKELYKKLKHSEIKSLVDLYQSNKRLVKQRQVENMEELYYEYQNEYMNFLQRQPTVEQTRQKLINSLAETHTMMSALNNVPSFDKPALWNKSPLSIEDGQYVQQYVNNRIEQVNKKYQWTEDDIYDNHNDILNQVDRYLELHYFREDETK